MRYLPTLLLMCCGFVSGAPQLPVRAPQYEISTTAGGAPPPTPVLAVSASFGPTGQTDLENMAIAADGGGNVYFTNLNCVFKLDSAGILTRVAGNSRAGYSGDGAAATNAQLNEPSGVAVDRAGNVYIAERGNSRIRRVDPAGIITTVVGNGNVGYGGDGGPAANAALNGPYAVAVDDLGNLYIADTGNSVIRRVSPGGIIATFAGNGLRGQSGDGGQATEAKFSWPIALAVSDSGDLYVVDSWNVRKISSGIITTVAGNGGGEWSGDGGPAIDANLGSPASIALDEGGNLFIADEIDSVIRKVSSLGVITTVAGVGIGGYSGDGGPAISAHLSAPNGVAVDGGGNLYIGDAWNGRLRKVASGIITTVAGNDTHSYSGDGGPAVNAQLNYPRSVAVDASGNVFIADLANQRVRRVSASGIITTVAGNGTAGYSGDLDLATKAQLNLPETVVVDGTGNLFIDDSQNYRIRRVSPSGIITTVAGNGTQGYSGDGGPATLAQLYEPAGIAVDTAGNLYIADIGASRVRKVSAAGLITAFAGNGTSGSAGDGGPALSAQLDYPYGLAFDGAGNLFIACGATIRKVSTDGIITTVAGTGTWGYSGDGGPALEAQLSGAYSVGVDLAGNLFIGDTQNSRVRMVSAKGMITTVAGTGEQGYSGDGGPAARALLWAPYVSTSVTGEVWVADIFNNAIRVLKLMKQAFPARRPLEAPLSPPR